MRFLLYFRCGQVCQKWNLVASCPSLWKCLDLSSMSHFPGAKDDTLKLLRDKNLLSEAEQLNFSGWQKLTSSSLEVSCSKDGINRLYIFTLCACLKRWLVAPNSFLKSGKHMF